MNSLWKTRTGLVIVVTELVVGLGASSAHAGGCGRGHGHIRAVPVARVHVHRPIVTVSAPAPVFVQRPVAVAQPVAFQQPAPVAKFPLELVDIRLVDLGNPAEEQGPRFRVVLKNVTPFPLNRPFEVMLAAGISEDFAPTLPTAVQGLAQVGPGEFIPVDLRLPIEAMAMAYPGRPEPAPFSTLFVLIGGPKNVLGSSAVTTLAVLPLNEVQLVDLTIGRPANPVVAVGSVLSLAGEGFGPEAGQILLNVAGLKLHAEVLQWTEIGVTIKLPELALTGPTPVALLVTRTDGQIAPPLPLTAVLPEAVAVEAQPASIQVQAEEAPVGEFQAEEGIAEPADDAPQAEFAPQAPIGQPTGIPQFGTNPQPGVAPQGAPQQPLGPQPQFAPQQPAGPMPPATASAGPLPGAGFKSGMGGFSLPPISNLQGGSNAPAPSYAGQVAAQ